MTQLMCYNYPLSIMENDRKKLDHLTGKIMRCMILTPDEITFMKGYLDYNMSFWDDPFAPEFDVYSNENEILVSNQPKKMLRL